nr:protein 102 [synthetic construct]
MVFSQLAGATAAAKSLAPTACTTIEEVGSTGVGALTLGFVLLSVTTVILIYKAFNSDIERRKYFFACTFICGISTYAYFAMLSGQGWTAISGCRQFFYARYVDWVLTTPLTILVLGLVAGVELEVIAAVAGADVLMIVCGYMGAVSVVTTVKWFWYIFGLIMFIPVVYSLARVFRETVLNRKDPEMIQLYGKLAWLTIIIWAFYPVVWLFSEGFASFSVSFEVVGYTIMDLIAKCLFCFMVVQADPILGPHTHVPTQQQEYVTLDHHVRTRVGVTRLCGI